MKNGSKAIEQNGVVWHVQGSGKSLTMVFLVKITVIAQLMAL
jgi:type I restriction enzyme R subunit